jgi:antitoxin component YwqK of YwqJK toxin-antitoxin module
MKKILTLLVLSCSLVASGQQIEMRNGLYYKGDKPYKGIIKESDSLGRLVASLSVNKGKLQGETFFYHENGAIKELRNYKNGLKHGVWYSYDEKGNKTALAHYKNDTKHGAWQIWDEQGTLRYHMKYTNGEKTGVWLMYDASGSVIMEKKF